VVPVPEGAEALPRDALDAALEANREMARLAADLREDNARLREENAEQAAELEQLRADLAGRTGPRERRGKQARPGGAGGAAGLLAPAAGLPNTYV
jgi:hypothetical protein